MLLIDKSALISRWDTLLSHPVRDVSPRDSGIYYCILSTSFQDTDLNHSDLDVAKPFYDDLFFK